MRKSLRLTILATLAVTVLVGCESKPSYEQLRSENEELHTKLSAALEHIEEAENQLNDAKNEIQQAQSEASGYDNCEYAESAAADAESQADD
jgi:outer membrane murein-binding lipoprotein Lpp